MSWRTPSAWLLIPWLALACGEQAEQAAPAPEAVSPISGLYEVTGRTVTLANGDTREIAGKVILAETEAGYSAKFSLVTTAPGADQAMPAEVIGTGSGTIEGRKLTGTSDTQIVMSTVPGVDPGFAFIPRSVSTRIASSSNAEVANDGTVTINIQSVAVPGHEYLTTRTSLRGRRISAAGIGGPELGKVPEVVYDDLDDYDPSDYVDEEFTDEKQ